MVYHGFGKAYILGEQCLLMLTTYVHCPFCFSLTPICLGVGPNLSYGEPKAHHGVPRHYELGEWLKHSPSY